MANVVNAKGLRPKGTPKVKGCISGRCGLLVLFICTVNVCCWQMLFRWCSVWRLFSQCLLVGNISRASNSVVQWIGPWDPNLVEAQASTKFCRWSPQGLLPSLVWTGMTLFICKTADRNIKTWDLAWKVTHLTFWLSSSVVYFNGLCRAVSHEHIFNAFLLPSDGRLLSYGVTVTSLRYKKHYWLDFLTESFQDCPQRKLLAQKVWFFKIKNDCCFFCLPQMIFLY